MSLCRIIIRLEISNESDSFISLDYRAGEVFKRSTHITSVTAWTRVKCGLRTCGLADRRTCKLRTENLRTATADQWVNWGPLICGPHSIEAVGKSVKRTAKTPTNDNKKKTTKTTAKSRARFAMRVAGVRLRLEKLRPRLESISKNAAVITFWLPQLTTAIREVRPDDRYFNFTLLFDYSILVSLPAITKLAQVSIADDHWVIRRLSSSSSSLPSFLSSLPSFLSSSFRVVFTL